MVRVTTKGCVFNKKIEKKIFLNKIWYQTQYLIFVNNSTQLSIMLLTPQHRRSSRLKAKAIALAKKETYDLSLQCDEEFASDQKTKIKTQEIVEEDIYADCPVEEGFDYDKDHYLASDRFASFIDEEIRSRLREER